MNPWHREMDTSTMLTQSFRAGGLEAKSRTEDETGIVFLQPQHMQHGVYTILSRWWTTRKKELKKQLEMWGADSVLKLTLNLPGSPRRRRRDHTRASVPRRCHE
jgi:hypothetical protein